MQLKRVCLSILLLLTQSISISINADDCDTSCGCESVNASNNCPLTNECGNIFGQNIYVPKSQGNNFARRIIGLYDKTHKFCADNVYGVVAVTFEYQKSFKSNDLASWFSPTGTSTVSYGLDYERDVAGTGFFDVNALNFGVTASGTLCFSPTKSDFITDIFLYVSWDEFIKGLWSSIDIPITSSKWNLNLHDTMYELGDGTYPSNSVGSGSIDVVFTTPTPMKQSFKGKTGFGDVPKLNFGKICGEQSDTTVATVRFDAGYDLCRTEKTMIAGYADLVLPIGTKPSAEFMFDAIVGNYNRWEFGVGMLAWTQLWQNCDTTKTIYGSFLININHVFGKKMQRLLSLQIPGLTDQENAWSQYLILKKFNSANQAIGLERAANVLAGDVKVKANVEANILASLEADWCSWMVGIGWEFWVRTKEELLCRYFGIPNNTYALLGSTQWNGDATDTTNNLVAPSTSISQNGIAEAISEANYLSNDNLSYAPALHPSVYSNKFFFYAGKNWHECSWQPFALVGTEIELGQKNRTFSMWAVFAKFGIGF